MGFGQLFSAPRYGVLRMEKPSKLSLAQIVADRRPVPGDLDMLLCSALRTT